MADSEETLGCIWILVYFVEVQTEKIEEQLQLVMFRASTYLTAQSSPHRFTEIS